MPCKDEFVWTFFGGGDRCARCKGGCASGREADGAEVAKYVCRARHAAPLPKRNGERQKQIPRSCCSARDDHPHRMVISP